MVKKKKIYFKHNQLVHFITETVTELCVKKIEEQKEPEGSYLKVIRNNQPIKSYGGTKEEALKTWDNLDSDVKGALTKLNIEPFTIIPHKTYESLPYYVKTYLQGYLYPFNANEGFFRNNAIAAGQALYQYIPGIKSVMLGEVEVCVNRKTGKKVDCTTGLALDGTHKITGFDVETSQIQIPSLFAYKGEGKMNTKYFCRPYLVGDMKIPENVRPKVLMYLQQAYSNKTGGDLGVNKKDWYSGDKQTLQKLNQKLSPSTDEEILGLVAKHITERTNQQETRYNAGTWQYIVGSRKEKEESYPLSSEQHTRFFKDMRNFAEMLLKTDCGFGVGKKSLTNSEKQLREKYGDVFSFMEEKPNNWEEMSFDQKEKWLDENESKFEQKEMTVEEEDEIQFWWDMVSVAAVVVGFVLTATGVGAPIGAALIALSAGMGITSGVFDLHQGQTAYGLLGIGLEVFPFLKVFKMSVFIKAAKIKPKKLAKILAYGLENGKDAMKVKYGKSGDAVFKALKENKEEMMRLLDIDTKNSISFLKRFSTMDAVEFYAMQRLNPAFKESVKNIPYKDFSKGVDGMSSILFANRKAWRTFLGTVKYNLGVPFKMILATLAGVAIKNTSECFDLTLNINGKNVLLDALAVASNTVPIVGLKTIKIKLDSEQIGESATCTLLAVLRRNIMGKNPQEVQELEDLLNQEIDGDVTVSDDGTEITINVEGEDVSLVEVNEIVEEITNAYTDNIDSSWKATIESYTADEEILEYWLFTLGNNDLKKGEIELEKILKGIYSGNEDDLDSMIDLLMDTDQVFINKKEEINQREEQLKLKYAR
tara:strand:+ start:1088 stop:3544 length:2457 start_codon:yes stop_codon:yes gene_type:complete